MAATENRLLTAHELADAVGVSLSTVRRMTRDGQIPVVRLRGAIRYDLASVVRARTHVPPRLFVHGP